MHQSVDDKPLILEDPIAPKFVDTKSEGSGPEVRAKPFRTIMVVRSRFAEDCLAEAVERGTRQYLILGAGLETFAYRQPAWAEQLRIYEVDHPATQTFKRSRLDAIGVTPPSNLVFVPVDFEKDSLEASLRQAGFDFALRTVCAWLGVTMYLTDAAIDETLATLRGLPVGSEIILSFNLPPEALPAGVAEAIRDTMSRLAAGGEPWISLYRPGEMTAKLLGLGFSRAVHFSPEDANARYCSGRRDGLRMPAQLHLMRAIV